MLERIRRGERIARNIDDVLLDRMAPGERLTAVFGRFFGSWAFVTFFAVVVGLWIALNSIEVVFKVWEPVYIQILHTLILNLLLALIVGLLVPIVLMRINQIEARDRARAAQDYELNLKTEWEMEGLHHKLDALDQSGERVLTELQERQVAQLETIVRRLDRIELRLGRLSRDLPEIRPAAEVGGDLSLPDLRP